MTDLEDLLREELRRTAQKVQPEVLRPLRVPAPGHGWRPRLLPLAAAAAVIAIIALVALVAGLPAARQPATSGSAPAVLPRFYVTTRYSASHGTEAVVRETASGKVIGTVQVPSAANAGAAAAVTAAADDRSFIIGAYETSSPASLTTGLDLRLFRLRISADGKLSPLVELPVSPVPDEATRGIALSPDGTLLAVSLVHYVGPKYGQVGTLQVINLATGKTRTWSAPAHGPTYAPGPPSWADGNRMIAFTWQRITGEPIDTFVTEGIRLLDTTASGDNLANAKLIVPGGAADGSIQSALITPDGREVIVATLRDIGRGYTGTVVAQIVEFQVSTGRLIRVLRTQTAPYDQSDYGALQASSAVLSLEPAGRYALVLGIQFGSLDVAGPDPGRFTPQPALLVGQAVYWAAW